MPNILAASQLRNSPVTMALIGISVVLYAAMFLFDILELNRAAIIGPLLISQWPVAAYGWLPEIRGGEIWRLITPIFLHFGMFHIVFNLLWIWELGRIIESRHGAWALLGIVAISAALSNLGQYAFSGPLFGGMSGVVYACFGYVWISGLFNPTFGLRLRPPVVYILLGWLAVAGSGVFSVFGLHIANTAHVVGLICGLALAGAGIGAHKLLR